MMALFRDQKLVQVGYAVEGGDKTEPVALLKKKFGMPQIDTPQITAWMAENGTLSVIVAKATRRDEGPILIRVTLIHNSGVGILGGQLHKPGPRQ